MPTNRTPTRTEPPQEPSDIAQRLIELARIGYDKNTELTGSPAHMLKLRATIHNTIWESVRDRPITPQVLTAFQVIDDALAVLEAQEGQEFKVLARVLGNVATLAAEYAPSPGPQPEPTTTAAEPERIAPPEPPAPPVSLSSRLTGSSITSPSTPPATPDAAA
jgi:hypothetical protein